MMTLRITKDDFDAAVPVAREPKGKVFAMMSFSLNNELASIEVQLLGEIGAKAVEAGNDQALIQTVKRLACTKAFLHEMRGLDLVLTPTGFGVVSTQDTAPASKQRVDALEGQLRRSERLLVGTLLDLLFRVTGWSKQPQRQWHVQTLFFCLQQLEQWAGISHPKPEDWDVNIPNILTADAYLRRHIGNAYMDELIDQLTSHSLTSCNVTVVTLCQQYIGASVAQDARLKNEVYMRLINRLEADLSLYPKYASSEAYRLNHFKPYENHAEDSAFHFVG
jgi:stage V sporulation protein SpoVS